MAHDVYVIVIFESCHYNDWWVGIWGLLVDKAMFVPTKSVGMVVPTDDGQITFQ